MTREALRLGVVICSLGRADMLRAAALRLRAQTRPPERVVLVVTCPEDVGGAEGRAALEAAGAEVLISARGTSVQRNAGLDAVQGAVDVVLFLDDDFLPSRHACARVRAAFDLWPDVSGLTGALLADGIGGPGLTPGEGERLVADWDAGPRPALPPSRDDARMEGLYGCNMAVRMSALGTARFDEDLPLYAWLEDVDFAARLPGRRVRSDALAGVHLGVKSGREASGLRLGYSQVVNAWHLWRKGSLSAGFVLRMVMRPLAANHWRSFTPEPWIDRRGRAAGNRRALFDIVRGRAHPRRILEMGPRP